MPTRSQDRPAFPMPLVGVIALCILPLAGCGGSGGGSAPTATGVQQNFGPLITRAVGTAQAPVVAAGQGAVITGVAGATFDLISETTGARTLDQGTRIAFSLLRHLQVNGQNVDQYMLATVRPDGTDLKTVFSDTTYQYFDPTWSPDGTKIAFLRADNLGASNDLFVVNSDGTGLKRLTDTPDQSEFAPSWSPDGTKIAFTRNQSGQQDSNIYVTNPAGTTVTRLLPISVADAQYTPTWSPDSKKLAFSIQSLTTGRRNIASANADGTGMTNLTNNTNADEYNPAWSPDGKTILFSELYNGAYDLVTITPSGSGHTNLTNTPNVNERSPAWSPDGTKIAHYRDGIGLSILDRSGQSVSTMPNLVEAFAYSWSPFLPQNARKFVGTGGLLASSCAGFLYGQQNKNLTSVVTVDAQVRADVRVNPLTGIEPGIPNIVFSITDNTSLLTSVRYLNTAGNQVVYAIGSGQPITTAAGVLVTFDAADGTVVSVLPYNANRSGQPAIARTGDILTLTGSFLGVFDGQGKNIAPQGAHVVRLDATTGKLLGAE